MTAEVVVHRIMRYSSQLCRAGEGARWRHFVFYDDHDVEVLEVTCYMREDEGVEDLFLERLPPKGFDMPDEDEGENLSEAPVG